MGRGAANAAIDDGSGPSEGGPDSLRSGDRVLLRWRGDGRGLPRALDGVWGSVMAVNRDRATVEITSPRGSDLHFVAVAAIERVERGHDREGATPMSEERLSPNAPEGPIAPPGRQGGSKPAEPAPDEAAPAGGESGGADDEDEITES